MSDQFTIRGFTASMRTRDVYACWPFPAGDATAEKVRSWLPPMTVPKFRWRADELGHSSSNRPDAAGEKLNPPSDEENELSRIEETVSRLGDGQRESENQPEEEKLKLENPPVEEGVPQHQDGEREPEDSLSEMEEEEENLENPLVESVPQPEDGEREPENSPEESNLSQKEEEEKMENPLVEEAVSKPDDGEKEPENSPEMVCPVCLHFKSATLTAVNAHIDGCLREERRREMMSKSKSKELKKKKKKKHSITEIIDIVEVEEQEENPHERSLKLWPFGDDISTTADKLRWLSQRLEALTSNNGADISTICRESEKSEMTKGLSSKPQKKRSIAEILEATPKIDGGNSNLEVREEKVEEGLAIESSKKKKKSKVGTKRSGVVLQNNKIEMMMMMKKKKNPLNDDDELAATKEDANKSMEQNYVTRSKTVEGNGSEKEEAENCDSVEKQQEEEEAVSPIFGILEISHKHIAESTSSVCNIQVPRSDSHVELSAKEQPYGSNEANGNIENRKEVSPIVESESGGSIISTRKFMDHRLEEPSSNPSSSYNNNGKALSGRWPPSPYMVSANMIGSLLFSTQGKGITATDNKLGTNQQQQDSSPASSRGSLSRLGITTESNEKSSSESLIQHVLHYQPIGSNLNIARSLFSVVESDKMPKQRTTVRLMGKDVPIEKKKGIEALPSTRKRPATADLVDDVTRPNNKLPKTGQSSRDAELVLDEHARLMMMMNSAQDQNLNLNLNPTSLGDVQGSLAGSKSTVEQSQNVNQEEDDNTGTMMLNSAILTHDSATDLELQRT